MGTFYSDKVKPSDGDAYNVIELNALWAIEGQSPDRSRAVTDHMGLDSVTHGAIVPGVGLSDAQALDMLTSAGVTDESPYAPVIFHDRNERLVGWSWIGTGTHPEPPAWPCPTDHSDGHEAEMAEDGWFHGDIPPEYLDDDTDHILNEADMSVAQFYRAGTFSIPPIPHMDDPCPMRTHGLSHMMNNLGYCQDCFQRVRPRDGWTKPPSDWRF